MRIHIPTNSDLVPTRNASPAPLDQQPAAVYLAGLAPGSRRTMRQALDAIAGIVTEGAADCLSFPWHELRYQHTAAIRSELAGRYSHTTANKMLSALRGVLGAAWRLGLMTAEDCRAAAAVRSVRGERLPAGRALAAAELRALLATCGADTAGARDRSIIATLYGCGLRRAELVGLDLADYDPVGGWLKVKGKRNKERAVPVPAGAAGPLAGWLAIRGGEAGPLFWGLGSRNQGGRLTTDAIYAMLQARAEAAGLRPLSPHDFRRTYVSELLDRGADIATVQKLAGHASVETTARYDRRGDAAKRRAADLLNF